MPYKNNSELPDRVRDHLPKDAQDIYREAFNHAEKEYQDPQTRHDNSSLEEISHKVAWNAVKKQYIKNISNGTWELKK